MPSGSNTGVCGSISSPRAGRYSAIAPDFGSSLPTYPPEIAVNHMFPSLSATNPCGPELGVFSGYSLNSPVFGSRRPSLFAPCPVYQSDPSGASAGSCGRDFGVGTSYSLICTLRVVSAVDAATRVASVREANLKDMGDPPSCPEILGNCSPKGRKSPSGNPWLSGDGHCLCRDGRISSVPPTRSEACQPPAASSNPPPEPKLTP